MPNDFEKLNEEEEEQEYNVQIKLSNSHSVQNETVMQIVDFKTKHCENVLDFSGAKNSSSHAIYICSPSDIRKIEKPLANTQMPLFSKCNSCKCNVYTKNSVLRAEREKYKKYDEMNNITFLLSMLPRLCKTSPEQSFYIQRKVMDLIDIFSPINSQP